MFHEDLYKFGIVGLNVEQGRIHGEMYIIFCVYWFTNKNYIKHQFTGKQTLLSLSLIYETSRMNVYILRTLCWINCHLQQNHNIRLISQQTSALAS